MKVFFLCVTILCIANVNGGLHSLKPFDDAASDRSVSSFRIQSLWNEANNIHDFMISNHEKVLDVTDSMPDKIFYDLWEFCKAGPFDEATPDELARCLRFNLAGLTEEDDEQGYMYAFVSKFFDVIDSDNNGSLNFKEFKLFISLLAATEARSILKAFDNDGDNQLNKKEVHAYYLNSMVPDYGNISYNQWAAMKKAFNESSNGQSQISTVNLTNFIIQVWGILATWE